MSKKVIISADSTCDLPSELIKKYSIVLTPLHVVLGEDTYDDMVNIVPDDIYAHFTEDQIPDIKRLNNPSICDLIDLGKLKKEWPEIRKIILEGLPDNDVLLDEMKRAGCAVTPEEINVNRQLLEDGLRYHSYMRYRVLLTRMLPMLGLDPMDYIY